ncbi:MAG: ABC transporter permease subunit, partial [Bradyrhizobium sp.]|uniref:ABC transporter permease subunit n=1 Tax=Bradyrhizobium sp. TaxID=376 RepID=UPI001D8EE51E
MLAIIADNWLLFLIGQYPHGPIGGLAMTLFMAMTALALCFPFAIAIALARLCPYRWLRAPATAIVHTVRGLPLIMFIFWTYFFSPVVLGRAVGGVETLVIALVVYEAAYLS